MGVAVFAAQEQAKNCEYTEYRSKNTIRRYNASTSNICKRVISSKIGYFKNYKFEGIDKNEIKNV